MTDSPHGATNDSAPHNGQERPAPEQLTRFFDWIRSAGMVRGGDRWLAGVCGAVARRTGLDPMIVRGIAIVLAVLGGPLLFAYAIGWALLPNANGRIHAEQLFRGVFDPAMVGIFTLILFTFTPFTRGLWWQGPPEAWGMPDWLATTLAIGWTITVIAGLVWLGIFLLRRVPAPAAGRPGHGQGSYGSTAGTAGTAGFVGTPSESTDAAAGASDPATASAGQVPPTPPQQPAPDAQRSAWDSWQEQNRAWQQQNRAWKQQQHAARIATQEAWHQHRHPGAGFSAIVLGLALAAGAATAGVYAAGSWSSAALLLGLAVTLGVLALGIIVAGIRGRDSGAMGGFGFLAAAALLIIGVFPAGTQFTPFGSPNWSVSSSAADAVPGYAMIAGRATVDLRALDDAASSDSRTIDVWLGAGETELILPADREIRVESNAIIGGVDYENDGTANHGNFLMHDERTINDEGYDGKTGDRPSQIRVWSLVGHVTVIQSDDAQNFERNR
ncbi:PspC domain-containing protein [Glaciibacter superstes]|uniref:PspC domain-containing protein n=1 Tax=Glaciibacter superstes TaxID=501023 RepID=UPI0003B2EDDD|nr:PspC domain-containing protein [Glaciibacter superstes]